MNDLLKYFLMAEAVMSILCFLSFGVDKWLAVKRKRRIRERTLHLWMWALGAPGGLLGMNLFRHKTAHASFWISAVLALAVQFALAWGIVAIAYR